MNNENQAIKDYCEQEGISHDDVINSEIEQEHKEAEERFFNFRKIRTNSKDTVVLCLTKNNMLPDCHRYDVVSAEYFNNLHSHVSNEGYKSNLNTAINFQNGVIKENGVNGCQNEDLIAIVIDRLQSFQKSKFNCRENALAITKLEEALMWLNKRTNDRIARGVEGTNIV